MQVRAGQGERQLRGIAEFWKCSGCKIYDSMKVRLDSNLIWLKTSLLIAGGWTKQPLMVLNNKPSYDFNLEQDDLVLGWQSSPCAPAAPAGAPTCSPALGPAEQALQCSSSTAPRAAPAPQHCLLPLPQPARGSHSQKESSGNTS